MARRWCAHGVLIPARQMILAINVPVHPMLDPWEVHQVQKSHTFIFEVVKDPICPHSSSGTIVIHRSSLIK